MRMTLHFTQAILLLGICGFAPQSYAGMDIGLSGGFGTAHLGLQTHTTKSGSASVSIDLGSYFRIGYSYRLTNQYREGYMEKANSGDEKKLVYFEQEVLQNTHSLDIFAILYAGQVFTPYVFVGAALKSYKITYEEEGTAPEKDTLGPIPVPNYGVGLAINISRSFKLKLSNTWSTGFTQKPGENETQNVTDSQLDVGISYRID